MGYTIGYVHVIDEASLLAPLVLQVIYHISIAVRWPSGASPPPTRSTALSSLPLLRCAIGAVNSCDTPLTALDRDAGPASRLHVVTT